jgi:hypothetical protein
MAMTVQARPHRFRFGLAVLSVIPLLAGCGGPGMPGFQFGGDANGSTAGFDDLPFELRRADGQVLTGHAAIRLLQVDFTARDATGGRVCSGHFTLDRQHAPVPVSADCTGAGILHGQVVTARADRGDGVLIERSGGTAQFRYGALL